MMEMLQVWRDCPGHGPSSGDAQLLFSAVQRAGGWVSEASGSLGSPAEGTDALPLSLVWGGRHLPALELGWHS